MENIKNCNNYKTLGTYNSNILHSNINYNSITENFGGSFSISAAVRYPWAERPCNQPPCSQCPSCPCDQSPQSCGRQDIAGI